MKSNRAPVKKIQRGSCGSFVLIAKEVMEALGWRAMSENCKITEIPDERRHRLILQRVTFDEPH